MLLFCRCVLLPSCELLTQQQHLLHSFVGMQLIRERTHGRQRVSSVTKSLPSIETLRTQDESFGLSEAHDKSGKKCRNRLSSLSVRKWGQFKMKHLYTTKDPRSEDKVSKKGNLLGYFLFVFPEHIIQLQVQPNGLYSFFRSFISSNYTYANVSELVSDA